MDRRAELRWLRRAIAVPAVAIHGNNCAAAEQTINSLEAKVSAIAAASLQRRLFTMSIVGLPLVNTLHESK